jgi:hypothetical protein
LSCGAKQRLERNVQAKLASALIGVAELFHPDVLVEVDHRGLPPKTSFMSLSTEESIHVSLTAVVPATLLLGACAVTFHSRAHLVRENHMNHPKELNPVRA